MPVPFERVHVVGAGAWGTALAQAAAIAGREVVLVARSKGLAEEINRSRLNAGYLPGQTLDGRIGARGGFGGLGGVELLLLAAPAQASRAVLGEIGAAALSGVPVVLCAKGLEAGSLDRQSEVLADVAPSAVPLVLSGPSFAADVAAGRPTAVTLAGLDPDLTFRVAEALAGTHFRPYVSGDLVGVELAGALKNVYALACGAVEGAGLGLSARSALIARAYAEMSRLVAAMGGQSATLTGLAGLGDLTLSCTSRQSRNYAFGVALGEGLSVPQIRERQAQLAEGVTTAPVALELGRRHAVDMPLAEAVNLLLAGRARIDEIVAGLMSRPLKREEEG